MTSGLQADSEGPIPTATVRDVSIGVKFSRSVMGDLAPDGHPATTFADAGRSFRMVSLRGGPGMVVLRRLQIVVGFSEHPTVGSVL